MTTRQPVLFRFRAPLSQQREAVHCACHCGTAPPDRASFEIEGPHPGSGGRGRPCGAYSRPEPATDRHRCNGGEASRAGRSRRRPTTWAAGYALFNATGAANRSQSGITSSWRAPSAQTDPRPPPANVVNLRPTDSLPAIPRKLTPAPDRASTDADVPAGAGATSAYSLASSRTTPDSCNGGAPGSAQRQARRPPIRPFRVACSLAEFSSTGQRDRHRGRQRKSTQRVG